MTEPSEEVLAEEENEQVFRERIVPQYLSRAVPHERPVVVIVGGQTGAGKTNVTNMVWQAMGPDDSFVKVNMDFYNPYHPRFSQWQAEDEATAVSINPDAVYSDRSRRLPVPDGPPSCRPGFGEREPVPRSAGPGSPGPFRLS